MTRSENEILSIYIDISALFRRQALPEDTEDAGRLSSSEYFLTYLRTLDSRGAALPPSFLEKLRRALRHYGDDSLEPSLALKDQLLLVYRSNLNMEKCVPALTAILERRLAHAETLLQRSNQIFPAMLDRLASVSEGRFPLLGDLARDIKYRYFDLPAFERARGTVYAEMDCHLTHLLQPPDTGARGERVQALVECPHPLVPMMSARLENAPSEARRLILEVLTQRFYRIRKLENIRTVEVQGHSLALTTMPVPA